MYNSPTARYTFVYHQGRQAALVSHHALACILLRLDDMQPLGLMIYNSCEIDDMHAFGVIWQRGCSSFLRFEQSGNFVLTYFDGSCIMISVLTYPECTIRWRLLPFLRGERKFLFSPFEQNRGEVVTLYITLVELLMLLSLLIALAEYFDNRRDK